MAEKKKTEEKQKPKAKKETFNKKLKINGTLDEVLFALVPKFKK